jgi:hypothetical protein
LLEGTASQCTVPGGLLLGVVAHPVIAEHQGQRRQGQADRGGDQRAAPLRSRLGGLDGGLNRLAAALRWAHAPV